MSNWGNDKTRTPGPWTTFVDLVHGLHSWTTDYSRGPLAKFRLPNINPSLGSRDWRELFHYSFPLFISQSIQFLLMIRTVNTKSEKMLKKCSQGSLKNIGILWRIWREGGGGQRILLNYSNFTVKKSLEL